MLTVLFNLSLLGAITLLLYGVIWINYVPTTKGKDEGPMREETRQRRRAFDFLKVLIKKY